MLRYAEPVNEIRVGVRFMTEERNLPNHDEIKMWEKLNSEC